MRTIAEQYLLDLHAVPNRVERKAIFRAYALAIHTALDERKLTPCDPLVWRRVAQDEDLPFAYLPAWRSISDADFMALMDSMRP